MKMAFISRAGLGLAASLILSSSAFAASIAPPSYNFTLKGGGNLNKSSPSTIWACGWTMKAQTTSSTGGTIAASVGDTNSNCGQVSVQPTTFSITSATTGVFHGIDFRVNGGAFCSTGADVPFTIMKNGSDVTSFFFNSASFGNGCNYNANLSTGAALTVN